MHTRRTILRHLSALPAAVAAVPALLVAGEADTGATPHPDAVILALFRRWAAVERAAEVIDEDDEDAFDAATVMACDIARQIAATPAATPTGIAIKAFLWSWMTYGAPHGADVLSIMVPALDADPKVDAHLKHALATDAARLVPEIAAVVG